MKLVPLGDKIVLKQLEAEETTKSGIVLPGQAKEKPQEAEVIAVGPGGNIDGKEVVMQVNVGDKVIYSKYSRNRRGAGRRRVYHRKTERYPRDRNRVNIISRNKEMY